MQAQVKAGAGRHFFDKRTAGRRPAGSGSRLKDTQSKRRLKEAIWRDAMLVPASPSMCLGEQLLESQHLLSAHSVAGVAQAICTPTDPHTQPSWGGGAPSTVFK